MRVAAAKAGPDFIDPTFHARGERRAVRQSRCLGDAAANARRRSSRGLEAAEEIVLCEGVMGLFDGTGADGEAGSTAELARITGWPVVLVVDARGQGASVAALLRGFAQHQADVPLAGVIFNRVASERHRTLLAGAVMRHLPGLAILGALPADPALALPSRHLGLVPAGEIAGVEAVIERAADQVGAALEIDRLLALARSSILAGRCERRGIPPLGRRIAVARDDAFCFAYPAVSRRMAARGRRSLLLLAARRRAARRGCRRGLSAGRLSRAVGRPDRRRRGFFAGLRRAAAEGKPIYGECGGYMVLGEALIDADGRRQPMAGLLPLVASFAERRRSLGYRSATLLAGGPLGRTGSRFRGHEFHYATVAVEEAGERLWSVTDAAGADLGASGLRRGSVFGSFIHLIDRSGGAA